MLLWLPTLGVGGCAGAYGLAPRGTIAADGVSWFSPALRDEQLVLDRWASAVGPPVVQTAGHSSSPGKTERLALVSWNTAIGSGDLETLVADVRRRHGEIPLVLLLQEVYRSGPEVPSRLQEHLRFAGRLGNGVRPEREIQAAARRLGLNLYYVASMRNGAPGLSTEDRGNAILSTFPLTRLQAIELPFERQRRVAVAADVSGLGPAGEPWNLRVVSVHLDNMVGLRRGWFAAGEYARARQSRALVEHLGAESSVVLGGDFNTWFGFSEIACRELAQALPDARTDDRRPTFLGLLRLDHLFMRLPDGWTGEYHRAAHRYGSDHHPLIATITIE